MAGKRHPPIPSEADYQSSEDVWIEEGGIGEGGFGVVKLFVNKGLKKEVVIKECRTPSMRQDFVDRWFQELEILKRLHHPNIVRALNMPQGLMYQCIGQIPFICMEYCSGGDLRKVLRAPENCCGLMEEQIRQICGDITAGIRFLHSEVVKVIHRDLKPENILIKRIEDGKVVYKLTDFGYSKTYDQNSVCTSLVGTMQYVAPEVMQDKTYHSSVDFWSFGVVVFECITGKRPFLHGGQPNNIAWISKVAQKQPEIIYIYYSKDGISISSSSCLPQPHRLSKNMAVLLTSWLQTALHYNPEKRGLRQRPGEDASCLSRMDHILSTKVIDTICMSSGKQLSFSIDGSTTYEHIGKLVCPQSAVGVPPQHQLLILSSGQVPPQNKLLEEDMSGNIGKLFVFTPTIEPSFRLIQSSNESISALTAYGDGKFSYLELEEIYSHVFFHIRKNLTFFRTLQEGHSAILEQVSQKTMKMKSCFRELEDLFLLTKGKLDMVKNMNSYDYEKLEGFLQDDKLKQSLSLYLNLWKASSSIIGEREKELETIAGEIRRLQEESKSYLKIIGDLQTVHSVMDGRLEEYSQKYVASACERYAEIKRSKSTTHTTSMQDILLQAHESAQSIIEDCLNGRNYGQVYSTVDFYMDMIGSKREVVGRINAAMKMLNEGRRADLWEIVFECKQISPSSSLHDCFYQNHHLSESNGLIMAQLGNSASSQVLLSQMSAEELRRQFSSASSNSVESISDVGLAQSMKNLQRNVSEEDNTRLIQKNCELRSKYQFLSPHSSSSSESDGRGRCMEESRR